METSHTVNAAELGRVLHNAALFASKDEVRPVLTCVELSLNGKVEATATDSYRLGHDECSVETFSQGETTVLLEAKELAAIAKELLKAHPNFSVVITTSSEDGQSEGTKVTIAAGNRIWVLTGAYGTFPKWQQLIPAADAKGEVTGIALNSDLLASFAKVNDGQPKPRGKSPQYATPMRLTFQSALKPVLVNIGATFVGVIMPVRTDR